MSHSVPRYPLLRNFHTNYFMGNITATFQLLTLVHGLPRDVALDMLGLDEADHLSTRKVTLCQQTPMYDVHRFHDRNSRTLRVHKLGRPEDVNLFFGMERDNHNTYHDPKLIEGHLEEMERQHFAHFEKHEEKAPLPTSSDWWE